MNLNARPILSALLRNRTGALLVALQIALALAILVNAAYLVKQKLDAIHSPSGIDEANLFALEITSFTDRYDYEASLAEDMAYLRSLDGVIDGIVANRAACTAKRIKLESLRCAGGRDVGDACLSDAQVAVVNAWTSDLTFKGAKAVYAARGYPLTGNEDDPAGFGLWVTGAGDVRQGGYFLMQDSTVQYYLANDPKADSLKYAPWDKNPTALDAMAALNDATDADIRPFIHRGGKLIVWQGGSDAALSVNSTIDYVSKMQKAVGAANAAQATRFYVAPGVNHCSGGTGADQVDLLTALDDWVTRSVPPATLIAEKRAPDGSSEFSRPLCLYPSYPRYKGSAAASVASSQPADFVCTSP